jgi:hypothetical protein
MEHRRNAFVQAVQVMDIGESGPADGVGVARPHSHFFVVCSMWVDAAGARD